MNFAYRMKKYREDNNISLLDAAKAIHMGTAYILKIENGVELPPIHIVEKLAKLYNVKFRELQDLWIREDSKKDKGPKWKQYHNMMFQGAIIQQQTV